MSIAAFIREDIFRDRLKKASALVVYDPDRRYRDICSAMEDDATAVVDASESSIDMALEITSFIRAKDQLFVFSFQQVAAYSLDGYFMFSSRLVTKFGALLDGKSDVRSNDGLNV